MLDDYTRRATPTAEASGAPPRRQTRFAPASDPSRALSDYTYGTMYGAPPPAHAVSVVPVPHEEDLIYSAIQQLQNRLETLGAHPQTPTRALTPTDAEITVLSRIHTQEVADLRARLEAEHRAGADAQRAGGQGGRLAAATEAVRAHLVNSLREEQAALRREVDAATDELEASDLAGMEAASARLDRAVQALKKKHTQLLYALQL